MNKPKVIKVYAIHPGHVVSKNDGDIHYIGYCRLMELYGLRPFQCVIWDDDRPMTFLGYKKENYVHLYPRRDGNYTLKGEL